MNVEYVRGILEENNVSERMIGIVLKALRDCFGEADIINLYPLKKGMTNHPYYFKCKETDYLLRVPGEGTEVLLDRYQEAWVYHTLKGKNVTDNCIYMDPETGVKVTEYIMDAHTCDVNDREEVRSCIRHLRHFHDQKIPGRVEFDVFDKIDLYESGCRHDISVYFDDYAETRRKISVLQKIVESMPAEKCLCHVDSVCDNFLIKDGRIYLVDWEYAAVGDPHMDIAMFCIYAGYDKSRIDEVIGFYFKEGCSDATRKKIYAYVASCGLLWTLWCEIKRDSGVLFEEYEKTQYRYAKEFYEYIMDTEDSNEATQEL